MDNSESKNLIISNTNLKDSGKYVRQAENISVRNLLRCFQPGTHISHFRGRPQRTSATFRGGGGTQLQTFADVRGGGVSGIQTSAFFKKVFWILDLKVCQKN